MKIPLLALAVGMVGAAALPAQEFIAPGQQRREIVPEETIRPQPSIEGIVKDIFVTRKPWQLVNPVAPASYGSGEKMVSRDFGPGTPYKSTGLIVLGVEW